LKLGKCREPTRGKYELSTVDDVCLDAHAGVTRSYPIGARTALSEEVTQIVDSGIVHQVQGEGAAIAEIHEKPKEFTLRVKPELFSVWEREADEQGITTTHFIRDAVTFYLTYRDVVKSRILTSSPTCDHGELVKAVSALSKKVDELRNDIQSARATGSDNSATDEVVDLLLAARSSGALGEQATFDSIAKWLVDRKPALAPYLVPSRNGMSALQQALIELQARGKLRIDEGEIIVWGGERE
jgi:hypothetical protein